MIKTTGEDRRERNEGYYNALPDDEHNFLKKKNIYC